jgi:hypothetical protein
VYAAAYHAALLALTPPGGWPSPGAAAAAWAASPGASSSPHAHAHPHALLYATPPALAPSVSAPAGPTGGAFAAPLPPRFAFVPPRFALLPPHPHAGALTPPPAGWPHAPHAHHHHLPGAPLAAAAAAAAPPPHARLLLLPGVGALLAARRGLARRLARADPAHVWLLLKLAIAVAVVNQDGSRRRGALLAAAALAIFLQQTGVLAPLARWLRAPPGGDGVGAGAHAAQPRTLRQEVGMALFGFVASLLPGWQVPEAHGVVRAHAE